MDRLEKITTALAVAMFIGIVALFISLGLMLLGAQIAKLI